MITLNTLKKLRVSSLNIITNTIKRIQLYPYGLRAKITTNISMSADADGGGNGGRIIIDGNTIIDKGVILRAYGSTIKIGKQSSIHAYSLIQAGGPVDIGNYVRIASHTVIVASNHIFDSVNDYICHQGETKIGIIIEDDVWIGSGVKILDGVTIRRGSIIGAGSVVTKSTEEYSVLVGNPARIIKYRNK